MIQKIDNIILNSDDQELSKIQDLDKKTQLTGISFYDVFLECYCDKIVFGKSSNN